MAQETLHASSLEETNGVWAGTSVVGSYDSVTSTLVQDAAGDWAGWLPLADTANTPTDINHFKLNFWNTGSAIDDDTFTIEFYNLDDTTWYPLTTIPTDPIATTDGAGTYEDGQHLTDILAKFNIAANKKTWINAFAVRWDFVLTKGADDVVISTQGIELEIEYTAATGIIPIIMAYIRRRRR